MKQLYAVVVVVEIFKFILEILFIKDKNNFLIKNKKQYIYLKLSERKTE